LSREQTESEINWSLGTYLEPRVVERAFGVSRLPRPDSVAPNQPFPHKGLAHAWKWLFLFTLLAGCAMLVTRRPHTVYQNSFQLEPPLAPQSTQTVFSEPFDLAGKRNIRISLAAPVTNTWAYVEGDLIDEGSGLVQSFATPIEFY